MNLLSSVQLTNSLSKLLLTCLVESVGHYDKNGDTGARRRPQILASIPCLCGISLIPLRTVLSWSPQFPHRVTSWTIQREQGNQRADSRRERFPKASAMRWIPFP